jgi:hypothetical protein
MPRNMSFTLTTTQIRNRTKTVTRRLGWSFLKPGDIINACVKCMGLKKNEKIERLCQIRITSIHQEPLNKITQVECIKEGFPEMTPVQFIQMFTEHMKCTSETLVNRIEFEYVKKAPKKKVNTCHICGEYVEDHKAICDLCYQQIQTTAVEVCRNALYLEDHESDVITLTPSVLR